MIAINYVNFCWFSSYAPISIVTEHGLHWFNHSELSECTRIHPLTGHTHSRQFLSIGAWIQYFRVVWDHKKAIHSPGEVLNNIIDFFFWKEGAGEKVNLWKIVKERLNFFFNDLFFKEQPKSHKQNRIKIWWDLPSDAISSFWENSFEHFLHFWVWDATPN